VIQTIGEQEVDARMTQVERQGKNGEGKARHSEDASSGDCCVSNWLRWIIFDGSRKVLIGILHCLEGGEVDEEDPSPDTWVEWLRWEGPYGACCRKV
jgi:hypothetical protein